MLLRSDESFRMGHHPQDLPADIGDPRDIPEGAVGIGLVSERDKFFGEIGSQMRSGNKLPFAVTYGTVEVIQVREPW
jgi:hypothetical protein